MNNSTPSKARVIGEIIGFIVVIILVILIVRWARSPSKSSSSNSSYNYSYSSGNSSRSSSNSSSSSSHKCLVCGESASYQLGSYWYCYKHYTWAKATADDLDKNGSYGWGNQIASRAVCVIHPRCLPLPRFPGRQRDGPLHRLAAGPPPLVRGGLRQAGQSGFRQIQHLSTNAANVNKFN